MRSLYLWRHAKSSWSDSSINDHDRPLAARGHRAALAMAAYADSYGVRPALVLCSSALRARQTLDALSPSITDAEIRVEDELYGADATELLARLHDLPAEIDSVLLVGHNPGIEDLALLLTADGEAGALTQLRVKYPTGALAILDLDTSTWARLAPGDAYLTRLVLPRDLNP